MKLAFYDYKQPIEYVVDRYFQRRRLLDAGNVASDDGMSLTRGEFPDDSLPEIPCTIIRDESGSAFKFIYGDVFSLEDKSECDPVIWQEELVRNEDGIVVQIVTTYPDGEILVTELERDGIGRVTSYIMP